MSSRGMVASFEHRDCCSEIKTASLLNKRITSIYCGQVTQMTKVSKGHKVPDLRELRIWKA